MINSHSLSPRRYRCITVDQPIGTFYVSAIDAHDILPLLAIERRGLTSEEKTRVQRSLDPARRMEISRFAKRSDATFPTSVTLSANSDYVHFIESTMELVIGRELDESEPTEKDEQSVLVVNDGQRERRFAEVPNGSPVALVVDGQHRVEGLRLAGAESSSTEPKSFQLTFAFMFDLSPEEMAKIFVTINSTQRRVDPSLIADLFGLSSKRSPQRTCHLIAEACNSKEKGPFEGGLKMLGRRVADGEMLSQGSFCKYIMRLISRNPEDDERRLNENPNAELMDDGSVPLRSYFIRGQDEVILRIVDNYFTAVSLVYEKAWKQEPSAHLMRKTVGFSALVQFLIKILPASMAIGIASLPAFQRVLATVHLAIPDDEWAVKKFSSSEADATKMCKRMLDSIAGELEKLLKGPDPQNHS